MFHFSSVSEGEDKSLQLASTAKYIGGKPFRQSAISPLNENIFPPHNYASLSRDRFVKWKQLKGNSKGGEESENTNEDNWRKCERVRHDNAFIFVVEGLYCTVILFWPYFFIHGCCQKIKYKNW